MLAANLQASEVALEDGAFDRLSEMRARDAAEKATPAEAKEVSQEQQAGYQSSLTAWFNKNPFITLISNQLYVSLAFR